ncbi:MAG: phosphoribosylamine--glycine ligase [Elusimicrobia bacterium HGW-Elusimicrobia-3]|nr:MAG: phosphoribosylamine--glycine ligase [Elusimicrobia bacterium HGW-Elusimicrobia-3]
MNVLIIGSGGREHALAWKIKQSPLLGKLHCLPGSAAIAALAVCPGIAQEDQDGILGYCLSEGIDLVVIGPEAPLAGGLADLLTGKGIKVFGPSRKGAMLESSKQFAKEFMDRNGIPTAGFAVLYSAAAARERIAANRKYPVVIKADGLAAGKGVRICADEAGALAAVEDFMERRVFGAAGSKVVLEEFLTGREASVMALTDGESALLLPAARDHKRLLDGDAGPNTGGMGAVCPVEIGEADMETISTEVIQRFLDGIKKERLNFRGVIYAGLMFTPDGPKVLEFNVRFGDPETQAVLPVIKSDLLPALAACAEGKLAGRDLELTGETCVAVVAAAAGYPEKPEKGRPITGLYDQAPGVQVFHAGTAKRDEAYLTAGGRVLAVAACGTGTAAARERAYGALSGIKFEGMQYRKDIGL